MSRITVIAFSLHAGWAFVVNPDKEIYMRVCPCTVTPSGGKDIIVANGQRVSVCNCPDVVSDDATLGISSMTTVARREGATWVDDSTIKYNENSISFKSGLFSPDKTMLVANLIRDRGGIFRRHDDSWELSVKFADFSEHKWSPDSKMLAFKPREQQVAPLGESGIGHVVKVIDTHSGAEILSLMQPWMAIGPWTADSKHLLIIVHTSIGVKELRMLSIESGTVVATLQLPEFCEHFRLSPNGRFLAARSVRPNSNLYVFSTPRPGDTVLHFKQYDADGGLAGWYLDSNRLLLLSKAVISLAVARWAPRTHYAFAPAFRAQVFALVCAQQRLRANLPIELILIVIDILAK